MDKQTNQQYSYKGINVASSLKRNFVQTNTSAATVQVVATANEVAAQSKTLNSSTADFLATASLNRAPLFNPPPPKVPLTKDPDPNPQWSPDYFDDPEPTPAVDLAHLRTLAEKYVLFMQEVSLPGSLTSAEFTKKVTEVLAFYSAPSRSGRLEALVSEM